MEQDQQKPIISVNTGISLIECKAFEHLTFKEKLYSYYFTRAAWAGAKICYFQRSYEAPGLFYILNKIFNLESPQNLGYRLLMNNKFTTEEIRQIYIYIAAFLNNCGNYKSFGDSKFVPEIEKKRFYDFIQETQAYQKQREEFNVIWDMIQFQLFEYKKPHSLIDLVEKDGQNSYYSPGLSQSFLDELEKEMHKKNLSVINTRVAQQDGRIKILIGSAKLQTIQNWAIIDDKPIDLVYGDFSPFLNDVAKNLTRVSQFTANSDQDKMIEEYVKHFNSGDMDEHKESQKHWINDRGPVIETNIGFIETYLDPLKIRAEYEGFVAVVNQEESKLLNNLVQNAEKFIQYLPWSKDFECETFKKPDFTSLEILAFASSGTPVGINIPNYDDIRQNFGFKNVNLGNVYGKPNKEHVRYLGESDVELFVKYYQESLFIVVALHELLGHGTGKLFIQDKDGNLNFDQNQVKNPFTNQIITSFYTHNEHWHSRFGELSGAYEECKADAVALYLSTFDDVIEVLLPSFSIEQRHDIVYTAWIDIIYSSLKGLEYYQPQQKKWGQPHILASYVLTQIMIQEDPNFITFKQSNFEGKPYFFVELCRDKIWTVGRQAVGKLLKGLQTYKSIGAGEEGMNFFNQYTTVNEEFLEMRNIILQHKTPRKLELQSDIRILQNGNVELVNFEQSVEGLIQSQIFHYGGDVEDVKELFLTTQQLFKPLI